MKFILLIAGCFICLQAFSQKKLLILGSSTSICFFGPSTYDSCYVARLQKYYQDKGAPFILDNRAIAGDNCYHGMPLNYTPPPGRNAPRPYYNITEGLAANPDIVLVNYPSNNYDIYSVQEVMFCLRTIRQTANNAGKPCYVTTTQPRNFPDDNARRKMAEIKDSVLKEFGSYAINFWDGIANPVNNNILDIYNADGTHLNDAGHAILFRRVADKDIMNQSPASNGNGLKYRYYEGNWNLLPDFNSLVPLKTGSSSNVDLSVRPGGVNDYFAFVWEGYINIPKAGTYTFETVSDDGSKLYFNSQYSPGAQALVNSDGLHGAQPATGTITIAAAGVYPISITFFEKYGDETMQVFWSGPGIDRQRIPDAAFIAGAPASGSGLNYKYYEGNFNSLPDFNALTPAKTGNTSNIDLGVRPANVNDYFAFVWEGYISVPTAGTYTFETISDDGSKLYFNSLYSSNGSALVNNNGLHGAQPVTGSINIPAAGVYPIAITFFEKYGDETMQIYWSGPGFGRQRIPDAAFTGSASSSSGSGLNYKYYEGNFSSLPDFNALAPVKTGTSSNIDLGVRPANVNDRFAFIWQGYIDIPTAGTYTFETISDDGSKLYFNSPYSANGSALVNNDGLHGAISAKGTTTIAAGRYPVSMTFFENYGDEIMQVYWSGPGIDRQLIPNSAFTRNAQAASARTDLNENKTSGGRIALLTDGRKEATFAHAYPNPFTETLSIEFYNTTTSNKVSVGIYDLSGRLLSNQDFGNLSKGTATLKINAENVRKLAPGMYIVNFTCNGSLLNKWKLLKTN